MKNLYGILGGVAAVGLLIFIGYTNSASLSSNLPPKDAPYANEAAALAAAQTRVAMNEGGRILTVLGTGSMQPFIPAAAPGLDPYQTHVAFVVLRPNPRFADVRKGDLCSYVPEDHPGKNWLHLAALKDADGWVMSGLNNPRSESWMRMRADNFVGIVDHVFTWEGAGLK